MPYKKTKILQQKNKENYYSKKSLFENSNKTIFGTLNQKSINYLSIKNTKNKINKCYFHTRDPYKEYEIARFEKDKNKETLETFNICSKELERVSGEVVKCFNNELPFSYLLMENERIGYALHPDFLITYCEISIENQKDISLWIDLDDVGLLSIDENNNIRINMFWENNYNKFMENISMNSATQKIDPSENTEDNNAITNFEWNWKKLFIIAFFGVLVIKEIYSYFNNKTQNNNNQNTHTNIDNQKPNEGKEESLKSIYEESWDPIFIEILIKILVPYSIYMLYKFRYYIYYKYFKLWF